MTKKRPIPKSGTTGKAHHGDTSSRNPPKTSIQSNLPGDLLSSLRVPFAVVRLAQNPLESTAKLVEQHLSDQAKAVRWFPKIGMLLFAPRLEDTMLLFRGYEELRAGLAEQLPEAARDPIQHLPAFPSIGLLSAARSYRIMHLRSRWSLDLREEQEGIAAAAAGVARSVRREFDTPYEINTPFPTPIGALGKTAKLPQSLGQPQAITYGPAILLAPSALDGSPEAIPLFPEEPTTS